MSIQSEIRQVAERVKRTLEELNCLAYWTLGCRILYNPYSVEKLGDEPSGQWTVELHVYGLKLSIHGESADELEGELREKIETLRVRIIRDPAMLFKDMP